jgi:hypothetical protein
VSILLPIDDEANDDDEEDTKDSQGGPNRRADDDFRDEETKGQRVSHGFTAFLAQYMGWIKAAVAGIRQTWVQRCLNRSRIEGSYCDKRVLGIHKMTVGRLIQLGK